MTIQTLKKSDVTENLQQEITILYKQLNSSIRQLPLREVLEDEERIVFVYCVIDAKVVGIASMALYKVLSGSKGMIEDVVVDTAHRLSLIHI